MTVRAEIRPIPEPPREVVLTMPYDVAVSLRAVMRSIAGDDTTTHRQDTDAIERALDDAKVHCEDGRFTGEIKGLVR